jgi:hypothetical protein
MKYTFNNSLMALAAGLLITITSTAPGADEAQKPESKNPEAKTSATQPKAAPATDQQIKAWIAALNSDQFAVRQQAVSNLVGAGPRAIPAIELAAKGGSLEVSYRSVYVLREMALSLDEKTTLQAEQALERLSEPGKKENPGHLVKEFAGPAIKALTQQKHDRAVKLIKESGGRFDSGVYGKRLDLHKYWHGDDDVLKSLRHITDLAEIYIQSPAITDRGLAHLAKVKALQRVTIDYSPDRKISAKAAATLDKSLANGRVLFFQGGFLGVRHDDIFIQDGSGTGRRGSRVVEVVSGSAAANAGMKAGDLILEIDKKKVGSSDDLLRAVAVRKPGDIVEIRVRRAGSDRVLKAKLGARPPNPR